MEEIVLKREASVTSAEALDQINASYPDAEILSFRRIKEAGNSSEFFIARIRVAAMADESDDVVLDSDEIVIEDKKHEDKEEEKMNQIIDLLKQLVDEDGKDKEETEGIEPALPSEDHEVKPLPEPQEPPFGVGDVGGAVTNITPVASIIVQRKANVSKRIARLELIREFASDYRIGKIEKHGKVYRASLYKLAEEDDDADRINALAEDWQDRYKMMEEQARHLEAERKKNSEERRNAPTRHGLMNLDSRIYSPEARHWLEFMDESGASDEGIENAKENFRKMDRESQGKLVKDLWNSWRKYNKDWEPEAATGEVKRYEVNERARAALNRKIQQMIAQMFGDDTQAGAAQIELRNLNDLARMLPQIPTEEQYPSVMNIIGEMPKKPSPKDVRSELTNILRNAPVQQTEPASISDEIVEEAPEKPEGWDPNDRRNQMGDFGVTEYTPPRTYNDYMDELQPTTPSSPNVGGSYLEYLDSLYGPSRGEGYYDPQYWEQQLAEYNKDPEGYETGWSGNIKNRVVR